ncbi:hypothetical protein B0I35DRAFT_414409 [Stachybotrys elegans]|uniref:Uncharacterized protein n=1 Tax=Stachybotrys elegans TaxID=80388 RepID=A0A8K0SFL2_9HYPO|nr:hypothetical protein B0I35DRAFT_414409 [Stachybotrys elegans]
MEKVKQAASCLAQGSPTFEHGSDRDMRATFEREAANYKDIVVYTMVSIHKTYYAASVYYETTTLPVKTLDKFTRDGGYGALEGRSTRTVHNTYGSSVKKTAGVGATTAAAGTAMHYQSKVNRSSSSSSSNDDDERTANRHKRGLGSTGMAVTAATTATLGSSTTPAGTGNHSTVTTEKRKPSFMDKLNPRKDADGNGKAGFLD